MGNQNAGPTPLGQTESFVAQKIQQDPNKDIVALLIDDTMLPNGGVFVVGKETVE